MDPVLSRLNPGNALISYLTNTHSSIISQSAPMVTTWRVSFILIKIFHPYSSCSTHVQRPTYFILRDLIILKQALSSWNYLLLKQDVVQCNKSWVTTHFSRVKAIPHLGGGTSIYTFHSYCANWLKFRMKNFNILVVSVHEFRENRFRNGCVLRS
jgi:hypothetical protein